MEKLFVKIKFIGTGIVSINECAEESNTVFYNYRHSFGLHVTPLEQKNVFETREF